ncbi:hypothetical protein POM88_041612 [Heracleum sosnowskyi]|uniref:RNase H type-1 domain-containing protein n=1 Tax=Heracleum sosnowskyi TaxID=360622 RepID=A0AAD8HFB2_9APIA|nr:hypothetical protein POM88_041612 [Heracleum sosnowskyi]
MLLKKRIGTHFGSTSCSLCDGEEESLVHLFWTCKIAREVWSLIFNWWSLILNQDLHFPGALHEIIERYKDASLKKAWKSVVAATLWSIWLMRNEKKFRGGKLSGNDVFFLIKVRVREWLMAGNMFKKEAMVWWDLNPTGSLTRTKELRLKELLVHDCELTLFIDGSWKIQKTGIVYAGVGGVIKNSNGTKIMSFNGPVLEKGAFEVECKALELALEAMKGSKWRETKCMVLSDNASLVEEIEKFSMDSQDRRLNELYAMLYALRRAFFENYNLLELETDHGGAYWEWKLSNRDGVRLEHQYIVRQLNTRKEDENVALDVTLINEESNRLAAYLAEHGARHWTQMVTIKGPFGRVRELWFEDMGLGPVDPLFQAIHDEDLEDAMNDEGVVNEENDGINENDVIDFEPEKLALWQDFRRISALLDSSPTIFIGDFNEVRFQRERSNCNTRPREMREFNKWIEDSNLLEIPLENANFTWIGPSGKRSRLDRAFTNSVWPNLADWTLKVLPRKNSDQRGILLRARQQNWGSKPFRVFNVWLRNPSLKKKLENYFSEPASLPNLHIQQKLRNGKHVIKTWNLSMNGNIFHRISELEEKVAKLEEDNGPRNELAILKMSLEELCLTRDNMLKQKARVDWLKEGDRNTIFFHQPS